MITKTIEKGCILIAKPSTIDLSFNGTVILIVNHDITGTVGFIANQELDVNLDSLFETNMSSFKIFDGGPVQKGHLYFIHKRPDLLKGSVLIYDEFYWGGNILDLQEALKNKLISNNELIFFLGYSGWSLNQLEKELADKSWVLSALKVNIFEEDSTSMYQNQIKNLGGKYLKWIHAPKNPKLN